MSVSVKHGNATYADPSVPVLTADAQFRTTANAAAQAFSQQPPYIAFRVDVKVDIPALQQHQAIARAVEARTRDDLAVLQDLPNGQNQLGHTFPVPPTFDALSYFRIDFHLGDPVRRHNPLTALTEYAPLTYKDPVPSSPDVTVVVTTLRNYYAHYADDSNDHLLHIQMDALPALTRGNSSDFYLHDIYVDPQTNLPVRVTYVGPTTTFSIDYTTVESHWVINHAYYRHTITGPFHIGQTTFTADATYSNFTFPQTPSDVRLR